MKVDVKYASRVVRISTETNRNSRLSSDLSCPVPAQQGREKGTVPGPVIQMLLKDLLS